MDTKQISKEQISAFADGELSEGEIEVALAALRSAEQRSDWELYHRIGDVLRSDDMDVKLSADFATRMAARLDAEPTIVAPVLANKTDIASNRVAEQTAASGVRSGKRWTLPGLVAAAAVAGVAFITTPHLMVAMKGATTNGEEQAVLASTQPGSAGAPAQTVVVSANAPEGVVLRDSRIDDYLLAHQRFSPSVYSTAQYARSATFANDSTK